jgi:hypothetical protein
LLEVLKISPAPTAIISGEEKPRKTSHFQAVDPQAVFVVAGDNQQLYRPQENPGNSQITYGAGDAVGILRRLLRTSLSPFL